MKTFFAIAACAALGIWLAWPGGPAVEPQLPPHSASRPPAPRFEAAVPPAPRFEAAVSPAPEGAPVPAARSMADTRLHGDPLSPPIGRPAEQTERASARELADPKAYSAFEARQTAQVYAAYVRAVDQELPRLREDIARARSMGIDAAQIEKAEAKARGLEEMRRQLLANRPAQTDRPSHP